MRLFIYFVVAIAAFRVAAIDPNYGAILSLALVGVWGVLKFVKKGVPKDE